MLAIIALMGFTASIARAYDHDSIKESNTETADATTAANAANGNASSAAQNVNKTAKGTEDKLDDAQRAQDELPANATKAQQDKAQDDVNTATANANVVRDGSANPKNVDTYRQALKERRDARKRLKLAIVNLQRLIQLNNQRTAVDMTEYNHTVRDAKKAEKDVDSHVVAISVTPVNSQVYVARSRHEEPEIQSNVARYQDRESARENNKQVVGVVISLRPHSY